MNIEFVFRIIGGATLGVLGWLYAVYFLPARALPDWLANVPVALPLAVLGAVVGFLATPYVTTMPFRWLTKRLRQLSTGDILATSLGLIIGLGVGALLAGPLAALPGLVGRVAPTAASLFFAYIFAWLMVQRKQDLAEFISGIGRPPIMPSLPVANGVVNVEGLQPAERYILVDTSSIIDGRIADISQTGFVDGVLLIPRFVLNELQHIADSADALRRNRGRRGLEMLNRMQKEALVPVQITDIDAEGVAEVDSKLIKIARQHRYPIITNDYNLNRVAELQGVKVLNINELANAIKPVVLPGETMDVHVVQEGKELGQGVGYLDDGTMVVVENGRNHLGQDLEVIVTRVLQTTQGRMIFAQLR